MEDYQCKYEKLEAAGFRCYSQNDLYFLYSGLLVRQREIFGQGRFSEYTA